MERTSIDTVTIKTAPTVLTTNELTVVVSGV